LLLGGWWVGILWLVVAEQTTNNNQPTTNNNQQSTNNNQQLC
jgi:hypothetical protein